MLTEEEGRDRFGDDAILTNVIAFDVRVYDPGAPVQIPGNTSTTVAPGDPGYSLPTGTPPAPPSGTFINAPFVMTGAYVDLGYGIDPGDGQVRPPHLPPYASGFEAPLFFGAGDPKSQLVGTLSTPRTFCTWSTHYESDALDQDNLLGPDQGTNGIDDLVGGLFPNGLIDDLSEAETQPPYPLLLPGLEVRIRCYEPVSRQVRQITIRHAF